MAMGLRFRRTLKIAPGLRLNFNKNSIGLSIGPRGAKYTINSSGRRTASVGIPGTGLYYSESVGGGRRRSEAEEAAITAEANLGSRPGFFAPGSEKAFYKFADNYLRRDSNKSFAELNSEADRLRTEFPKLAPFIDFLMVGPTARVNAKDALAICERLYANDDLILEHPIATKYFDEFTANLPIARGITLTTDYNNNFLTFSYSEILQALGQPEKALEVIQRAKESEFKDVAILDIYISLKKYEEIIADTDDLENKDDLSAIKLVFRAIAMRELGDHEIAIEIFKSVTNRRSRSEDIRTFALYERALTYEKIGKKANAIKDLQKILSINYDDNGAREKLDQLKES
jgi:tetratricopeptide (TPR) repeat protein